MECIFLVFLATTVFLVLLFRSESKNILLSSEMPEILREPWPEPREVRLIRREDSGNSV